jgi:hypothetical protein
MTVKLGGKPGLCFGQANVVLRAVLRGLERSRKGR